MTKQTSALPPLLHTTASPDVFATEAVGFLNFQGNIFVTLSAPRPDYSTDPAKMERVVIGRLVMPIAGAQHFALGLYDFLKKQGLDPTPPVPERKAQN